MTSNESFVCKVFQKLSKLQNLITMLDDCDNWDDDDGV